MDDIIDVFEKAAKVLAKREEVDQLKKERDISPIRIARALSELSYLESEVDHSFKQAVQGAME